MLDGQYQLLRSLTPYIGSLEVCLMVHLEMSWLVWKRVSCCCRHAQYLGLGACVFLTAGVGSRRLGRPVMLLDMLLGPQLTDLIVMVFGVDLLLGSRIPPPTPPPPPPLHVVCALSLAAFYLHRKHSRTCAARV